MKIKQFCQALVVKTEDFLTWYKSRDEARKERQKRKNQVLDWIEAFLWAAAVVLLVNQYLFQAYTIPSGSMIDTLQIKDRIFVNKMIYGPELIPGHIKLPGFAAPKRFEVMIFESPEYESKGPVFDIAQRLLYMLTFSIVDIDGKDEFGRPKVHFLIKRLVAMDGDCVRFRKGDLFFSPKGSDEWIPEENFKAVSDIEYHNSRMLTPDYYQLSYLYALEMLLNGEPSPETTLKLQQMNARNVHDQLYYWQIEAQLALMVSPHEEKSSQDWWRLEQGQYIPEGWILPLGDNRDNSNDGRFFGPVPENKVLGRAMFIYWPLPRMRTIK